ncbi:ABC transporter substrate-binding protein [Paenibacillus barengoltzii]|uniref:Carbohydrate ABC transporter substrate-binding protein, CUT1 family (TC 3.A.1.1.-) n=1 Tax=Paenibacillus barengoltzii J12 TaxID=935846 RepID=A0ABY1LU13_9BACL|nr:extracellular solute-binding protein [Paenibacillus barengoltzii]SME99072.1 carbohydrate ABC transporter substrate-binding protein, CUT1 family (TC 3.A.1.1.-) [Paenibacillus barengoltzii J12]
MSGKKMMSLFLTMFLMTGILAACGGGNAADNTSGNPSGNTSGNTGNTTASENPPAQTGGKVDFWLDKLGDAEKAARLAEAWRNDSGIEVELTNYPDVAAYQTAIQQTIDDPGAPGLFTWWSGPQLETLAKNGKLADLTAEWDNYIADGVSADIKDAFTVDGKVYAAPYSLRYMSVLYNVEVFEAAGVAVPTTFEEFLEACEKIKASGVTPIGLKNDSWASFIWFQQLIAAYDPQLYIDICNGTKPYTDEAVKEVMTIWRDMFNKGYFGEPIVYSDLHKEFATGVVAMMLDDSPTVTGLQNDFGMEPGTNVDAFILPSMNGAKGTIFFEASPIVVTEASSSKEQALAALRGFYKPGTQAVMVGELGIANISSISVENGTIQRILDMTGDSSKYQLLLRFYENTPEDLRNTAIDELSRFMYSGADIDDVLNTIQAKADEVFG